MKEKFLIFLFALLAISRVQANTYFKLDSRITTMSFDSERVYIGTEDKGVFVLKKINENVYILSRLDLEGLPVKINHLATGRDHILYVATEAGLYFVKNNALKRVLKKNQLASDNIRCVAVSPNNLVWIGTDNGIARMNGDQIDLFNSSTGYDLKQIDDMQFDDLGQLWILSDQRLYRISEDRLYSHDIRDISSFTVNLQNQVLIWNSSGLYMIDELYQLKSVFKYPDLKLRDLYVDELNQLWGLFYGSAFCISLSGEKPVFKKVRSHLYDVLNLKPEKLFVDADGKFYFTANDILFIIRADSLDGQYSEYLSALAMENMKTGRYPIAFRQLKKLLDKGKNYSLDQLYAYAQSLDYSGYSDKSLLGYIDCLNRYRDGNYMKGTNDESIYLKALFQTAENYRRQRSRSCVEPYQEIIRMTVTDPLAEKSYFGLIHYYLSIFDYDEAAEWYEKFIEHHPSSGRIWEAKEGLAHIIRQKNKERYDALLDDLFRHCNDFELLYGFDKEYDEFLFRNLIDRYKSISEKNKPFTALFRFPYFINSSGLSGSTLTIGTDSGVTQINIDSGKVIARLTEKDGLLSNKINRILDDTKGNLWICSGQSGGYGTANGGLSIYNGKTFVHFNRKQGLEVNEALDISISETDMVVCNSAGLFRTLKQAKPQWKKIEGSESLNIRIIRHDNKGILWAASEEQLFLFDGTVFKSVMLYDSSRFIRKPVIRNLYFDPSGSLNIITSGGLFQIKDFKITATVLEKEFNDPIVNILKDQDDLWVCTENDILRYEESLTVPLYANETPAKFRTAGMHKIKNRILFIVNHQIFEYQTSASDTLLMLHQYRASIERAQKDTQYSNMRKVARSAVKISDYFRYSYLLSYLDQSKPLEAYSYFQTIVPGHVRDFNPPYTFFRIMKAFKDAGDQERAEALLEKYLSEPISFAGGLTENESDDNASLSLRALPDEHLGRMRSYIEKHADSIISGRKYKEAVMMFGKFYPYFRRVGSLNEKLKNCADTLYQMKDWGQSLKLFKLMQPSAENIPENMDLYWKKAKLYENLHQFDMAVKMYDTLLEFGNLFYLRKELTELRKKAVNYHEMGMHSIAGNQDTLSITSMAFEGNFCWLGTTQGLMKINLMNGSYRRYTTDEGLLSYNISDILIDTNNVKWISGFHKNQDGSIRGGVTQYNGESFIHHTRSSGLMSNEIHCLTMDPSGCIIAGSESGYSRFVSNEWQNYQLKKKNAIAYIADITTDGQGSVWMAAAGDSRKKTGGVILHNTQGEVWYDKKHGLTSNHFYRIKTDPQQRIWVSTDKGLFLYDDEYDQWLPGPNLTLSPFETLKDFEFDIEQSMWVGSNKGLLFLACDSGVLKRDASVSRSFGVHKRYNELSGLLSEDITVIAKHESFGFFVGSRRGIFVVGSRNLAGIRDDDNASSLNKSLFGLSSQSEALYGKSQRYLEMGEYDKAREIYLDVLDRGTGSEWIDDAAYLLAQSYELEGKYDEAKKVYSDFIEKYPESVLIPDVMINMGIILEKENKYKDAIDMYKTAQEKAVNSEQVIQAKILNQKAEIGMIAFERQQTVELAAQISEKQQALEQTTDESRKKQITSELQNLEEKAQSSAKAAGYNLRLYKVRPFDTLWELSRQFLGDPVKWKDFFVANEGKISDPDLIYTGQTIVVLTMAEGYSENLMNYVEYTVIPGEDLYQISKKMYGNERKWKVIYQANKEILPESPQITLKKMTLKIPVLD